MAVAQQLKAYLIKDEKELSSFEKVIRSEENVKRIELSPPLDGVFLLKSTFPKTPNWLSFVQPALQAQIGEVRTQTSAGVLLLRSDRRIFAFTFGHGRTILRPDCYERDFGLRVALNSVNPDRIRSADMRRVEEETVLTRRQTSRATEFGTFRLDASQDLLRGVTGIPHSPSFATRIAGAEALTLSTSIDIEDLPEKCADLLSAYSSQQYKDRFGFIDHLRLERDPATIHRLEDVLLAELSAGNTSRMHLAPPEPEDWENVQGFTYASGPQAEVYADLNIDEAIAEFHPRNGFSIQYLRRKHIGVRYRDAGESADKYTAYSCIVYECELDHKLYVLSGGDWHQVDKSWADGVRNSVASLRPSSLSFPVSRLGEREAQYNDRVATQCGWALMDRKIVTLSSPYDRVEICDLLTQDRQFVHVKRKMESATLSHLFSQGSVSGELLFRSHEFREKCRDILSRMGDGWKQCIPRDRLEPSRYEIVYAIIGPANADWPRSLPFFSQLNLNNTASRLRELGYKVSLNHISVDQ